MDTITATREVERAAQLRKKIAALNERKRELESKHNKERAALKAAEDTRLALIKELAGADAAMEGWANSKIDKLDSLLVTLGRKVSALESALAAVVVELEPFTRELTEVQIAIQEQERAAKLRVFQSKMENAAKLASDTLDNARERLADLNRLAAQGIEAYGDAGLRISGPVVERFVLHQSNLDAAGWKSSSPSYTRLEFWIRSMTRG
jgi:chromosome segregation ATPase